MLDQGQVRSKRERERERQENSGESRSERINKESAEVRLSGRVEKKGGARVKTYDSLSLASSRRQVLLT